MRYYLDTEFVDTSGSVELISIGMVCEDNRELYVEISSFQWSKHAPSSQNKVASSDWLWKNFHPYALTQEQRRTDTQIAQDIVEFTKGEDFELWGYNSAYDWVAFCSVFGRRIDIPENFPSLCLDLKQLALSLGKRRDDLPTMRGNAHNALDDAHWNLLAHQYLLSL
jgi:hypothetical protein